MPNLTQRADAITPNNWSAIRDLLRDLAQAIDTINNKPTASPSVDQGEGATSSGAPSPTT
jgi:hypothetical protein